LRSQNLNEVSVTDLVSIIGWMRRETGRRKEREECVNYNGSVVHVGEGSSSGHAPGVSAKISRSATEGNGTLILVADDEQVLLRLTRRILHLNGFRVLEARNGQEAIDLYRQHFGEIDLVILDAMMPEVNGLDACRYIHQMNPTAKIILSTGYAEGDDVYDKIRALTDVHYVHKPYSVEQLVTLVRNVLGH
jgi:CheY-like chemotaxis protein